MKIAIISDTHFGFKEMNKELWADCYINAKQCFDSSLENIDLVLMPGDIFDLEIPTQETFDRTFKLFNIIKGKVPIVVIAGTHEYRGRGYKGPIDILESAKYVTNLSKEHTIIDDVAIHGMKGVPEKVSKDLLHKIDFKPVEGKKNIIMLHQSFKEFLPFDDEMVATLTLEDLPSGFDLYINGHIHLSNIIDTEKGKFLLPGSTILTQIKKKELEKGKGFYIYDSNTQKLEFKEIPIQRSFYLLKINVENSSKEKVYDLINQKIDKLELEKKEYNIFDQTFELKPIIKIKLKGTLLSGFKQSDIKEKDFQFNDKIVIIEKSLDVKELEEKIREIDMSKEKDKALAQSKGIFLKNLNEAGFKNKFDPEDFVDVILNEETSKAAEIILENKPIIKEEDKTEVVEPESVTKNVEQKEEAKSDLKQRTLF